MKKFRTEGPISYSKYAFSYCNWVQLEELESPGAAYAGGYLPYSGNTEDPRHLFYMARSLRVNLAKYSLEKKRRYDHKTWTEFKLKRRLMDKEAFMGLYGEMALDRAEKWMKPRFGDKALSMERLSYIIRKPYLTDILAWTREDQLTAFALLSIGDWGAHYWYVFYENGSDEISAPGHGYLVDFLHWAHSEELPHAYIGTSYGLKSRYKSRGLGGIEFWGGSDWNPDKDELKHRQEQDQVAG